MTPVVMPQVGQDITTGRIVEWHVKEGQPVRKGQALLTVESEKASFDVESPADGILLRILFHDNEEAAVLGPVGYIGAPGEAAPHDAAAAGAHIPGTQAVAAEGVAAVAAPSVQAPPRNRPASSPSARRVAAERGIDLRGLAGSGPGGRIMKRDIPAGGGMHSEAPRTPGRDRRFPFSRMRQAIADRLTLAVQTIPHFHVFADIDMEGALAWRALLNAAGADHVTVTDIVVFAAARALRDSPRLCAHVERDALILKGRINIGIAVAVEDGLLVPVVPDADTLDIGGLSRVIRNLAASARAGKVDPEPRGTFTVSSLGMHGVSGFLPVINPPESAILGVGAVEERAVSRGGFLGSRRCMSVTLGCDHRALNGADAARFLARLKALLETIGGMET
jgi:pyruvate dehydrogenase E2 component (dihydrolipoamide acetyltransferase)